MPLELAQLPLKYVQFVSTDARKGERVKNQYDGAATQTFKAHRFPVLVGKLEAGS